MCVGWIEEDFRAHEEGDKTMKNILIGLATIGFALPAYAQTGPDFSTVDSNKDGMVTMDEGGTSGVSWTEEEFKAADADGNGSLDEAEFAALIAN